MIFTATEAIGFAYGVTWNTVRRNLFNWKHSEVGNLEAKVKSFCSVPHLLRVLKDFILFAEKEEELQKIILRQHQTTAVDKVVARALDPKLARAVAWMESGFQQDVVSSVGAIGVMQLLPETWEFVDTVLLGESTPRDYRGNVRAGVRYLRWQLDQFGGDVRLALAGWYQGARAVREVGLYDDTRLFVRVVLALHGTV